ncbi:MAG: hypothetical protein GEU79_13600 [Acidimicrobiia bacterium]|nr:hypothetical protein [Acidimicrobiia bacterium]
MTVIDTTTGGTTPNSKMRWVLGRWPTVLGVAIALLSVMHLTRGAEVAFVLTASGLVYLGAAALGKRSYAWPMFIGAFVLITISKFAVVDVDPSLPMLVAAAGFIVIGVVRGAINRGFTAQTLAMVAIGAATLVALNVNPNLDGYLIAGGLFAHAGWDVYHHRREIVVSRSLAEFCFVLDTLVAIEILIVIWSGSG